MSPETEIRVDLVCTEFLSQFKRLKANAAAVPMTKAETIKRRWDGWELHTDWAFATPSFGSNFREDRRD